MEMESVDKQKTNKQIFVNRMIINFYVVIETLVVHSDDYRITPSLLL